jgi:hypothetical protein
MDSASDGSFEYGSDEEDYYGSEQESMEEDYGAGEFDTDPVVGRKVMRRCSLQPAC